MTLMTDIQFEHFCQYSLLRHVIMQKMTKSILIELTHILPNGVAMWAVIAVAPEKYANDMLGSLSALVDTVA